MKHKKIISLILSLVISGLSVAVYAAGPELTAPSALLMDYSTGEVLYEKNPHEKRPMASVTKIMTLLIAMEHIDSGKMKYDDTITGSAHAKSYGGSTIFLDEGEKMSVHDIIKGVAVASGNDAAVALGEHIAGSESAFVDMMNQKAEELGMKNTHFINCNGLDADGHYSSAYDIALMSRELMKHPDIFGYTTIWLDSLRNGEFTLSNTNKLIKFYDGATGLKTGSTDDALFCISATAKRGNMHLISVIMGAPSSKERQADASQLLNYGFANFALNEVVKKEPLEEEIFIEKGREKSVCAMPDDECFVIGKKEYEKNYSITVENNKKIKAPINKGDIIGSLIVNVDDKEFRKINLVSCEAVPKITFSEKFRVLLEDWLC